MTHSVIVKDEARDSPRDQGTAAFKAENEKLKQRKQVGKNDMENDRQNQWQIPIEKKIKRVQKRTNCLRKKNRNIECNFIYRGCNERFIKISTTNEKSFRYLI